MSSQVEKAHVKTRIYHCGDHYGTISLGWEEMDARINELLSAPLELVHCFTLINVATMKQVLCAAESPQETRIHFLYRPTIHYGKTLIPLPVASLVQ